MGSDHKTLLGWKELRFLGLKIASKGLSQGIFVRNSFPRNVISWSDPDNSSRAAWRIPSSLTVRDGTEKNSITAPRTRRPAGRMSARFASMPRISLRGARGREARRAARRPTSRLVSAKPWILTGA